LQLQTTISFKKKHILFELYNKLFIASHISLVFEKHDSIETLIYPAFSSQITQKCPILIKARSHSLPWLTISHWGTEAWKDQSQFTFNASKNFVPEGPVNDVVNQWRRFESDCSFRLFSNCWKL